MFHSSINNVIATLNTMKLYGSHWKGLKVWYEGMLSTQGYTFARVGLCVGTCWSRKSKSKNWREWMDYRPSVMLRADRNWSKSNTRCWN